jgi:hypothetical protein
MRTVTNRLDKLEHASPAKPLRIVWLDIHRADGFEVAERETAELERSGFDVLQIRWLGPGEGKQ